MAEFLKAITDKFLDFFNIGRAVSIFIPGALVSFVFLMLLSLAFFPPQNTTSPSSPKDAGSVQKPSPKPSEGKSSGINKKVQKQSTSAAAKTITGAGADVKKSSPPGGSGAPATVKTVGPREALSNQIAQDYNRVASHYWIVVLFSLVFGIILYEVGNKKIGSATSAIKLYRFKESPGANEPKLTPDEGNTRAEVGLIYFAPFLKEDFTGKENYYNFLVSEYYRFLEFSAVMPMAISVSSVLGAIYYFMACKFTNVCCHYAIAVGVVLLVLLSATIFNRLVFNKVYESYRRASADLIKGVTDVMNKDLLKK